DLRDGPAVARCAIGARERSEQGTQSIVDRHLHASLLERAERLRVRVAIDLAPEAKASERRRAHERAEIGQLRPAAEVEMTELRELLERRDRLDRADA